MRLPKKEIELFYKLHTYLLFYTNEQRRVVNKVKTSQQILELSPPELIKIRDTFIRNSDKIIDSFVGENPYEFTEGELASVSNWKNRLEGTFYVVKHLKKYTVFLSGEVPPRVYGVLGLFDELEELLPFPLPIMVKAVLLPFKDKIIYDGLIQPYRVTFGPGIRRSINSDYQQAKATFGIITSLPFKPPKKDADPTEQLKFYLKNQYNRERYADKIWELLDSNPDLWSIYHQQMGKYHARSYRKSLRKIGISGAWFAIVEGTLVTGAKTKAEVEQAVKMIVPAEKIDYAYYFQLR